MKKMTKQQINTLTLSAVFTAIVIVLQLMGAFIRFGTFSVSLVLLPIILGAALCGVKTGAWLGFVFGTAVLLSGDAAAFMQFDVFGTVVTVLLKGTLAGLVAGFIYKSLEKVNRYLAVITAALVCPIVNSGVFVLGCITFFYNDLAAWAPQGQSIVAFIFIGLVGLNFIFEVAVNIILSPAVLRVIKIIKKQK